MANEIKCVVGKLKNNWRNQAIDCTYVRQRTIYNKDVTLSYDKQVASTGISFFQCIMFVIPTSESIKKFIPNLTVLMIRNSKLSKITSEDLKGFDCLRDLYVENCEVEYLPGDLFKHTPNLEIVTFQGNKIKYIDEGILESLRNLKIFCLYGNVSINAWYDGINKKGNASLAQLKNEIKTKCSRTDLKTANDEQLKKITTLEANDEVQKKEIANLKEKYEDLKKKLETMSQQLQTINQMSKNFTVKVNDKFFSVHKAILINHSQVLAKLITDNPETDILELKDISEATFQEIINFMNDGSQPSEDTNMVELFEASCRLKIEPLTTIVADHLNEEVNQVNALDVLILCNKYDNYDELKMKAFGEVQKNFPNQTLMPELASQPEKLKMLMQAKLDMDEWSLKCSKLINPK